MEPIQFLPVSSLENAWSRLSKHPDYQRCITGFFKAPSFYVGCSGLFAGTSKATGRRAVYCNQECYERLSTELAARVAVWITQPPPLQLQFESVDDVQALDLKNERDVKALFKDLQRHMRLQKQSRQLAEARAMLLNVRSWTEPLDAARVAATTTHPRGASPVDVPSHALAPEPSSGSQSADDVAEACGPCDPCNGSCGATNHPNSSTVPERGCAGTEEESADAAGAASASEEASASGAASASEAAACAEKPVLRALHTAACSDPWVGNADYFGRSSEPPSSCCSSGAPSSAATPLWPPGTPRFAAASGGAASPSPAWGTPRCDSDSDLAWPGSPVPGGARPGGAAGATVPTAAGPDAEYQAGFSGGGAEGVLTVFCSIDLEWWERDNSKVTEVGWTLWDNLTRQLVSRHHIIAENEALVNRIYVPNHKHDFLFGRSSTRHLQQSAGMLQSDLNYYGERVWSTWCMEHAETERQRQQASCGGEPNGQGANRPMDLPGGNALEHGRKAPGDAGGAWSRPWSGGASTAAWGSPAAANATLCNWPPLPPPMQLVIVGHGLSQDLKALSGLLGVSIPPTAIIVDTAQVAWAVLEPAPGQDRNPVSLRVLLKSLGIPATKLHNGGNDARYTMEALLMLASLEPGTSTPVQQP